MIRQACHPGGTGFPNWVIGQPPCFLCKSFLISSFHSFIETSHSLAPFVQISGRNKFEWSCVWIQSVKDDPAKDKSRLASFAGRLAHYRSSSMLLLQINSLQKQQYAATNQLLLLHQSACSSAGWLGSLGRRTTTTALGSVGGGQLPGKMFPVTKCSVRLKNNCKGGKCIAIGCVPTRCAQKQSAEKTKGLRSSLRKWAVQECESEKIKVCSFVINPRFEIIFTAWPLQIMVCWCKNLCL